MEPGNRLLDRIGLEEDEIPRPRRVEDHGRGRGPITAEFDLHRPPCRRSLRHPLRDQAGDLTRLAPAGVGILVDHHALEVPGEHPPLIEDVGVAAVAGSGVNGGATIVGQACHRDADLLE